MCECDAMHDPMAYDVWLSVCLFIHVCRFMWWVGTHFHIQTHIFFTFEWDSLSLCVDKRKPDLCDQIELKMSSEHFPFFYFFFFPCLVCVAHTAASRRVAKFHLIAEPFFDCVESKRFVTDDKSAFNFSFYYRRQWNTSHQFYHTQQIHIHVCDAVADRNQQLPTDSIMPHEC